jgi:5-(carboxyamino)imidazole ribonucleotide mutase
MIQMPAGIPEGTTAIDKAIAKNAALLAAGVLALSERSLQDKLKAYRKQMPDKVEADDDEVRKTASARVFGE